MVVEVGKVSVVISVTGIIRRHADTLEDIFSLIRLFIFFTILKKSGRGEGFFVLRVERSAPPYFGPVDGPPSPTPLYR